MPVIINFDHVLPLAIDGNHLVPGFLLYSYWQLLPYRSQSYLRDHICTMAWLQPGHRITLVSHAGHVKSTVCG